MKITQPPRRIWLLLLLITAALACGEIPKTQLSGGLSPHVPSSALPPSSYVLRLEPTSLAYDTFLLKTCLHVHDSIVEQSCTPTFTSQQNTPVPITLATITATLTTTAPLSATAFSQLTSQQAYHRALHRASKSRFSDEVIVIGGGGTGAGLGAMIQHRSRRGAGHQFSKQQLHELTAERARLLSELEPYLVGSAYIEPGEALRNLINRAAKRTVFMPELITYLDQQGLPPLLRKWLQRHNFSVAHYLLHATKFENLLTPKQHAEYMRLGGADEFADQLARGMQRWLELRYQAVDARLLFHPYPRQAIEMSLLRRYEYYYEAVRIWDPRRQIYVSAQHPTPRAVRTQILNFMMGLTPPDRQTQPYKLGQLKAIPGSGLVRTGRAVAKHGLTEVSPIFYQQTNKLFRAHEHLSDYLRLQELTTLLHHNPRPSLGTLTTQLPWPQRLLRFMVKTSKGSALGAVIGGTAAAIIIHFQPAADPPELTTRDPSDDTTLIWPDESLPAGAMHALLTELSWQHTEQGGAMITQYCLPSLWIPEEAEKPAKACYRITG